MVASRAPVLYSAELLALAVELADYPYDADAPVKGHARSRSCGSIIELSSDRAAPFDTIGLKVTACAIGQASAAIFASEARGMDTIELGSTLEALGKWLEGKAPSSILSRLELLEPARPHRGRHEAILLPWRAALDALSKTPVAR